MQNKYVFTILSKQNGKYDKTRINKKERKSLQNNGKRTFHKAYINISSLSGNMCCPNIL